LFLFLFSEFFLTRLPPSERDYPVDPCLQLRHDLKLNFSFGFFKPSFGSVTCTHIHLRQKRVRDGFFSFKKHNICKNTTSLLKVKPNFEGNSFVSQLWLTCVGNSCFVCRSKMFCTGDPQKAKRGEKSERSFITHGIMALWIKRELNRVYNKAAKLTALFLQMCACMCVWVCVCVCVFVCACVCGCVCVCVCLCVTITNFSYHA
jgi:hypothetical protein